MRNRYTLIGLIAALLVALDQATKIWVYTTLPLHTELPVIQGFFNLVHVRNRGAAFGFLNRHDITWQFWLFLAAGLVALVVVFTLARQARNDEYGFFTALGLILGGAIGNLIDRVRYRAVIDFLDFYQGDWHWPAFNVADIAICCGAVIALWVSWQRVPRKKHEA